MCDEGTDCKCQGTLLFGKRSAGTPTTLAAGARRTLVHCCAAHHATADGSARGCAGMCGRRQPCGGCGRQRMLATARTYWPHRLHAFALQI